MTSKKANSNGTNLAAEWHAKMATTKRITLPEAGLEVEVRAISTATFFKYGRIPETLVNIVADSIMSGKGFKLQAESVDDVRGLLDFQDAICEMCIVDPVVLPHGQVPDASKNEISADWIPDNDKWSLVALLNMGVDELEFFRPGQADDVESVDAPEGNGDTGKSASADQ